MWYVYILECDDNRLYTGITQDLNKRFYQHKQRKGGHYTKCFGAKKLVYSESFSSIRQARTREVQLKGWTRKKKMALIKKDLQLLKAL